jgi:SNF2 family DNA or RNA helicase
VGINLTAASIVIFADMDWSPATHDQAIGRAHRIGTKKTVNAYFYVAVGTIEEDIIDLLNQKKSVLNKVIEGGANSVKTGSIEASFLKRIKEKVG